MAGVGVGVGHRIHWTGVIGTGLGGRFSGVRVAGTMVTLGDNAGWVSVGTLGYGAGKSIWSAPVGAGCGVFGVTAVGVLLVTSEKMRKRVFGWRRIDCHPVLRTGLELGARELRLVRGRPRWRRFLSSRLGRGNLVGRTLLFWRCVLRECVRCRRNIIGSGQGRVRGTIHIHRGGPRCGSCRMSRVL